MQSVILLKSCIILLWFYISERWASAALSQQTVNQPQVIPPKIQKTRDEARQRPTACRCYVADNELFIPVPQLIHFSAIQEYCLFLKPL